MSLPTKRNDVLSQEPSVLIVYGPPKVGKTSALAQLENALFLDCEQPPGTSYVSCMSVPISSFKQFIATCAEIVKEGCKYDYVIVDTIDALERMCIAEANIRYKLSNICPKDYKGSNILTDLALGSGYTWLWDCVRDVLDAVCKTSKRIIIVGHLKEKLLKDTMATENSEGADLDLTGKVKNIVCARADAIGLLKRKVRPGIVPPKADLYINFRCTDETNCGIRIERLAGKEFLFASVEDKQAKWEEIYPSITNKK